MSQTPDHYQHDEMNEQVDRKFNRQLLARLRGADPAALLPPLREDALEALFRATASTSRASAENGQKLDEVDATATAATPGAPAPLQSEVVSSLAEARRRRRRWTSAAALGLAAAAAGVIALGAGVPGLLGLPGAPGGDQKVTALQAAPSIGLIEMCAPIDVTFLAGRDLAFQGRVAEIRPVGGGEVVVLDVERVFRGDTGRRVEISTPGASSAVDGTVTLAAGQDYLVAALGGTVSGCGATGAVSPELESLYAQAFGGGS